MPPFRAAISTCCLASVMPKYPEATILAGRHFRLQRSRQRQPDPDPPSPSPQVETGRRLNNRFDNSSVLTGSKRGSLVAALIALATISWAEVSRDGSIVPMQPRRSPSCVFSETKHGAGAPRSPCVNRRGFRTSPSRMYVSTACRANAGGSGSQSRAADESVGRLNNRHKRRFIAQHLARQRQFGAGADCDQHRTITTLAREPAQVVINLRNPLRRIRTKRIDDLFVKDVRVRIVTSRRVRRAGDSSRHWQ